MEMSAQVPIAAATMAEPVAQPLRMLMVAADPGVDHPARQVI